MRKYSFILIVYVLSVSSWAILSEDLSLSSIGLGFILATFILAFTQGFISDSKMPAIRLVYFLKLIKYTFKVLFLIYASAFRVIQCVLKNNFEISVIEVDLPSDLEFVNAFVCNSITLTPGTLSLEKSENKAQVVLLTSDSLSKQDLKERVESSYRYLIGS